MTSHNQESCGLINVPHSEIERRISNHKLFGLDSLQDKLFRFSKAVITADTERVEKFVFYDVVPSVLLYGSPNTGKTTLCHLLFDEFGNFIRDAIVKECDNMLDKLGNSPSKQEYTEASSQLRTLCIFRKLIENKQYQYLSRE
jgi:DNA replication protein DnaC